MTFDEQELDLNRLLPHIEELASKFDTVQVFVTRHDLTTGATVSVYSGAGNWHARRGQVLEWVMQQDEISRLSAGEEFEDER